MAVLKASDYQPNAAARSMRTRRTGTIGVVVEGITNPFYPEALLLLGQQLQQHQLRMILWDADEGPGAQAAVEAIEQQLVDGLVFTTATEDSALLDRALKKRQPVVLVNRTIDGAGCDQVASDNFGVSKEIAQYFVGHSHRRIGLVAGPAHASTATEREAGFRAGLAESGIVLEDRYVADGQYNHDGGHQAIRRLLQQADPPTAVLCLNDFSAFGAIDGARSLKIRIPTDLWIVGFDDVNMSSWESFDLTTARQPMAEMVAIAVDLLVRRIDNPDLPATTKTFWCDLKVRGSTAFAPKLHDSQTQGGTR